MSAIAMLDEEECYLAAILDDPSGIELAEFCWIDEEQVDGCFRVWDFQWTWYHNTETFQIDQAGRSLGKSVGITMRAFAFPFVFPGQEMLITAPELNHLRPLTDKVENLFLTVRLGREMLPRTKGAGINHQPQFQARFVNGARIFSRLPNRDGKGVKGSCAAGTYVATLRGQVPIEEVVVGDQVLTHRGRYMPVQHVYSYEADTIAVAGAGHRGLVVSENHRFESEQGWAVADEAARWATPTMMPGLELPDPPAGCTDAVALLALAGRYVADGNLGVRGQRVVHVAITVKDAEAHEVQRLFKAAGFEPVEREHDGTARCLVVHSTALATWLRQHFGHLAQAKEVPPWLLGAPLAAREAFLAGYLAGDGHWSEAKLRWEVGTASKALAIGVRLLAQTLGLQASYSWSDPAQTHVLGTQLKAPARRSHRLQLTTHGRSTFKHGKRWGKVRSVTPAGAQRVYDLVVQEDYSYLADGIVSLGSAFLPSGKEA